MGAPTNRFASGVLVSASILVLLCSCSQDEIDKWASKMPRVGAPAPSFQLPANDGSIVSLEDFKGSKRVVLYFYPKDDTPGCTLEASVFRDRISEFDSLGAQILGISVDGIDSHEQFCEKHNLNFPLLSDTSKVVTEAYGSLAPNGMAHRSTFVIDENGNVRAVFPSVTVEGHADEVLRVLKVMPPLKSSGA